MAAPCRVGGLAAGNRRAATGSAVLAGLFHGERQSANRADKTLVADGDGAVLDHCGGALEGIAVFQFSFQRDAQNSSGGGIDGERAVIAGSLSERLRGL